MRYAKYGGSCIIEDVFIAGKRTEDYDGDNDYEPMIVERRHMYESRHSDDFTW